MRHRAGLRFRFRFRFPAPGGRFLMSNNPNLTSLGGAAFDEVAILQCRGSGLLQRLTVSAARSSAPRHPAAAAAGLRGLPRRLLIGSGFGGLAAAIRLGYRGYRVTLLEKLDKPGGRAYVHEQDGFKFDAGPTIITAPFLLDELWEMCGRRTRCWCARHWRSAPGRLPDAAAIACRSAPPPGPA